MFQVEPRLKEIAARQLAQRGAQPPGVATRPVTTVRSRALHGLQFRATVEGHEFISDEPEEGGGTDGGPAPLRYFLAGVMMCHQVWVVKSAALAGVALDRLESEVAGYLATGPGGEGAGFGRLALTVAVESPSAAEQVRTVVDEATRRCPAFATMERATRVDLTLRHNGETIHEQAYGRQPVD